MAPRKITIFLEGSSNVFIFLFSQEAIATMLQDFFIKPRNRYQYWHLSRKPINHVFLLISLHMLW